MLSFVPVASSSRTTSPLSRTFGGFGGRGWARLLNLWIRHLSILCRFQLSDI
jgi:hypothetical protein